MNVAILLFGKAPQRFLITSEIKCARFHCTRVAKLIPFYRVYKGTEFDLVDHGRGFRAQQDRAVRGYAGRERPGARGIRDSEGGRH